MNFRKYLTKRNELLIVFICILAIISFDYILRNQISCSTKECLEEKDCLAKISKATECLNPDGSWNSGPKWIPFNKYKLEPFCAESFSGSSHFFDNAHFNCGEKPI
jgi:hypothetical protein